jgi:hypothetical protein
MLSDPPHRNLPFSDYTNMGFSDTRVCVCVCNICFFFLMRTQYYKYYYVILCFFT